MIWSLVLFLVLPFLAFIISLDDLRKPINAIIFIAFYALFGYCNHFELITADIARIGYAFQNTQYLGNIFEIYEEGGKADVYSGLLFYYLLPFTNNPKVFCAVVAAIFGILSYAVYVNIYQYWPRERKGWFYVYILVALSNISLVHLTGIRYYTGGLLFLLSAINYIKGKKLWIIGIIIPGFIHFSLFIATGAFLAYVIFRKFIQNKTISFLALSLSLIISFFSMGSFAKDMFNEAEIENSAIESKVNSYTDEKSNVIEKPQSAYRQANSLFTKTFNMISRIGIYLFLLTILNKTNFKSLDKLTQKLLSFTVILTCVAFFAISLSEVAMRFVNLAWCSFFIVFPLILKTYDFKAKSWIKWLVVANFYSIAFLFINAPRLVTPDLWYMNVPYLIYEGLDFRITWFVI